MRIKHVLGSTCAAMTMALVLGWSGAASAASFTAGSSYSGKLDAGGVSWQCNAGQCKGAGSASSVDDDMKACQELVKAAGPLGSFKSSNGTEWSPTKNPNRMAFCNAAVAQR